MIDAKLFDKSGDYLVTVVIDAEARPDLILWNDWFFVWCEPCQKFKQKSPVIPIHTKPNLK